ncbi:MAG: SDR family oxidoreductase [Caldisericaceae bacterium]
MDENSVWTLDGKTCLITGATSGIGKVTAVELAKRGANIVFTARNMGKAEHTKEEIISASQNKNVEYFECDLSSFASIAEFVNEFSAKHSALHVLINNAGLWEARKKMSKDGIEMTFQVNYLAQFLMTNLLLPKLRSSAPARIINVSSALHKKGKISFEDITNPRHYSGMQAYYDSKLAIVLFTKELARRLEGSSVTANVVHPGLVRTDIYRALPQFVKRFIFMFGAISPEEGAKTTVYLATASEVLNISGEYFAKEKVDVPLEVSNDKQLSKDLWDFSYKLIGSYLKEPLA